MKRVALLRGINVGARNKILMKDLRSVCESLGWTSVETHLQTGNVVFTMSGRKAGLESSLEQTIETNLGVSVPVVIRDAKTIAKYLDECPLPSEAGRDPARTLLYVTKKPVATTALETLESRAAEGERIRVQRDSLWIYFSPGVPSSKLTPAVIERAVGSPATGRNWKTVSKIRELLLGST